MVETFCVAIGVHIASYHLSGNFNEINPGVYCQTENYEIGVYHNSLSKTSVYAARSFQSENWGLMAGVVTGYRYKAMPAIAVSYRILIAEKTYAKISVIPPFKNSPLTLGFSFQRKF